MTCLEGGKLYDNQRWWRYGQKEFVGLNPRAWHMPPYAPIVGWLDGFPEMAAVRKAFDDDPVLRHRVDALIGPEFSRSLREGQRSRHRAIEAMRVQTRYQGRYLGDRTGIG